AWDEANYAYAGLKVENGRITSCPIRETTDFYFAVMQDIPVDDQLTTVPTVDHTQYGITMKLVDFKTTESHDGSPTTKEQHDVIGDSRYIQYEGVKGLLSTDLKENGYPVASKTGKSLGVLYAGAQEVNHLFIGSTYSGSGYYEFDSTQNFASLQSNGDFKVYKELGTYDQSNKLTLKHGQFFPYNDLQAGLFAAVNNRNLYDAVGKLLPDSDPRKNERLYLIRNANCFFGLEIEASFTQTANGLDAWGHDIIYEFTGDDDFWLYVDGELIIDLGGIHSALPGSVNYSTGEVMVNGKETSLRDLFYENYLGRGHSAAEAEEYVDGIFRQNSSGNWVFQDYSTHTMKIFFMERGGGASNLHMRFNLSSVKPGTVLLSKELSGIDETESVLAEFPYQIWYKTEGSDEEHLLTQEGSDIRVFYKDSVTPVTYHDTFVIHDADGDLSYDSVFMLKPGEMAEIDIPDEAISYRIVECGLNSAVYRSVTVNGSAAEETAVTGHSGRKDAGIDYAAAKDRAQVLFVNEVDPEALRTLTITKRLFREDGTTEIGSVDDASTFNFRLYLATEFDGDVKDMPADMQTYHVKDGDGNYCSWNESEQKLVPLGISDLEDLTPDQKEAATFTTSMNGSITMIPAGFTVEVRNLLAGTRFMVEERASEIPDGYSFQKYVYNGNVSEDENHEPVSAETGIADTVQAGQDPHVDVCNLRGWGLRVNKTWSDAAYMAERDAVHFAVFTGTGDSDLTLVPDTVRRMEQKESTLYWYFLHLPVNVPFDQYLIREVTVSNPGSAVNDDGVLVDPGTVTPIPDGGELTVSGKQKGETERAEFTYSALYEKGTPDEYSHVRVDSVTNNRPGVVLKKADWNGAPLAGAEFVLKDSSGNPVGTFVSDAQGQITVAFLSDNKEYTLTETKTPQGWHGLEEPMTILLYNGSVTVGNIE
ncbi:MAG: hypothetical protein IJ820_01910, partial [Lachnospiraceae bacterium]|nr:hypothetical protein [Lachnospiraceae bacterium]